MAVQSLIQQHVVFLSASGDFDLASIMANSNIQTFAQNAAGNDLISTMQQYQSWNGSAFTAVWFYDLSGFVTSAFQTTIQGAIPALQAAFPQYTVVTWGNACSFGN